MANNSAEIDALKTKGNDAYQKGNTDEAIKYYGEALQLDPKGHVLYSNRSAAYMQSKKYEEALRDAEKAIESKPDWAKGYSRKGAALGSLNRWEESMMAYTEGLNLEPNNKQMKDGVAEAKSKLTGPAGSQPMNPFADSGIWEKIENDANTREFLKDPEYKEIVTKLQSDPRSLGQYMQDKRIMTTLGMLLGVQLGMEDEMPEDLATPMETDTAPTPPPEQPKKQKSPPPEPSDDQKQAQQEKEKGNAAYKKKDFETALSHYGKAVELDPTNVIYRNNRAAVYFEQGNFDQCIKEAEEGVNIGREHRADYKLIAKALARVGNAYSKKKEWKNALTYYNKSLSEHRDPEVVKKALSAQKTLQEEERLAYLDPEKAVQEKEDGNKCFTKGDYPEAIRHYGEAIKRNPDDSKLYSNRAACYTKLAEFGLALKDCDTCLTIDPTFVKGYLRKGACYLAMKDTAKASAAYQKALDLDANCKEALDGYRKCVMQDNDPEVVKKRAMQDPEVQAILADPAMQMILGQMQKDPKALQEHMKNPAIAEKIQKLLECGLIGIR